MNVVHPMETHDSGTVDERTGAMIGGQELDNDYNRRILPPTNPQRPGRPHKQPRYAPRDGPLQEHIS